MIMIMQVYAVHSYTDKDLDCLVPQRTLCHMEGGARYTWTHAIRPPMRSRDEDADVYDRWGTWEKVMARKPERISIILAFADPFVEFPPEEKAAARPQSA